MCSHDIQLCFVLEVILYSDGETIVAIVVQRKYTFNPCKHHHITWDIEAKECVRECVC